jgi:hypothetical protein
VKKCGGVTEDTDDNIIRRMRFEYWIIKVTDTHSEYATLIASQRQRRLRERASILRLILLCLSCRSYILICTVHFDRQFTIQTSSHVPAYILCSSLQRRRKWPPSRYHKSQKMCFEFRQADWLSWMGSFVTFLSHSSYSSDSNEAGTDFSTFRAIHYS